MTAPLPYEQKVLLPAERYLDDLMAKHRMGRGDEHRAQVLEAVAARLGGFDLTDFHRTFEVDTVEPWARLDEAAETILNLIREAPMHPTLALAALARERLSVHAQRKAGAHYTDFRLATFVGARAAALNPDRRPIVDPASGSGILLAATVLATCGSDRKETAAFIADRVVAADMSPTALRGARLVLASLSNDLGAIRAMTDQWHLGDSLMRPAAQWLQAAPLGFGAVVGNPPWEKLKIHRHEEECATGADRHYGAAHPDEVSPDLFLRREQTRNYARAVADRMQTGGGEVDLFAAFSQLMMDLSEQGAFAALLPAGLIRSQGTKGLRHRLFAQYRNVEVTIFDNKAKFFAIDTRFKFIAVSGDAAVRRSGSSRIALSHGTGQVERCEASESATIPFATLKRLRPDLSLPEVRGSSEWRLYQKIVKRGAAWQSPGDVWYPAFCREVDMTRERRFFLDRHMPGALPLVEGRMVHQHRFGAKIYRSGSGRKAIWEPATIGQAAVAPQFWVKSAHLPGASRSRVDVPRAAFCDIAGQTNERSMLAAVIPAGVVCGNKVPTVLFPNTPHEDSLHLWTGMVNSLAFDWLLRRVLTTTVNYFLLQSVPLPPIFPDSLPGRRIVDAAKRIAAADTCGDPRAAQTIAEARREIDLICLRAYGVVGDELELILRDFPSLDRSQPALPGERRSTVTADFLVAGTRGSGSARASERLSRAERLGAVAYVPSQVESEGIPPSILAREP